MKPNKSSDASKDVNLPESFPCQRIVQYNPSKTLELPISFTVKENKLKSKKKQSENKTKRIYLILMYVGFLLFIPKPAAERATFLNSFIEFCLRSLPVEWKRAASFLWWRCFPHCCRNRRSILTIFTSITMTMIPLLGGFHMAKYQNVKISNININATIDRSNLYKTC